MEIFGIADMITDPIFYRLFATSPETFFLVLGMSADSAGNGGAVPVRSLGIQRDGAPRRWRFSAQGTGAAVVFPRGAVLSSAERIRGYLGQGLYVFETPRP